MANSYDFIVNPGQQRQGNRPPFKLPGGKITLIAGVGIAAIIIIVIVMNVFFGGGSMRDTLLKTVQSQYEIVRISNLNTVEMASQSTKNTVANTRVSITSAQNRLTSFVGARGVSFNEKEVQGGRNQQTDESLKSAQAAGTLDSTLRSTLQTQLTAYAAALQATYKESKNAELRELLTTLYNEAHALLKQLEQS